MRSQNKYAQNKDATRTASPNTRECRNTTWSMLTGVSSFCRSLFVSTHRALLAAIALKQLGLTSAITPNTAQPSSNGQVSH